MGVSDGLPGCIVWQEEVWWRGPHDCQGRPRETLEDIAQREYGDAAKWDVIFQKNKWRFDGEDPKTIYPGMDLDIPEIDEG